MTTEQVGSEFATQATEDEFDPGMMALIFSPEEGEQENPSIPMLLWCPECGERHIDVGEFSTKPHYTHACQHCGMVWRPAIVCTVGVQFLPGFKNDSA